MPNNISIPKKRKLSVFSLVMLNIIAVDNLRTLPFSAKFGSALTLYYAICALLFFIPVAFITAELATTWPKNGGIYVWVSKAFGPKFGLLVIWLQWIYNVVWYPTILTLVAGITAFMFDTQLAEAPWFIISIVLCSFWLATILNCFGMAISIFISTIGSILGTLLPMIAIIFLGASWIKFGHHIEIALQPDTIIHKINSINDVALITTILFGLMGLEMSAVHAQDVKNPEKNYPKALVISSILILLTLILSSLAIAIVIPNRELNIVTGIMQAFQIFFYTFNLIEFLPIFAFLIIIGALSGVSTWITGSTKGLFIAAKDGLLPNWLATSNRFGAPVAILILQAIIVTLLCIVYVLMPTVASAYFILTELTIILALLMYVLMFLSAIVLRHKYPDIVRPYQIPGGNYGICIIASIGGLTSISAILLGFIPPSQIEIDNPYIYPIILITGMFLFCAPIFLMRAKPSKQ